jgi:hypothetical protein
VVVLITAVQIHFNSCCHRHTILAVFIIAVIILAVMIALCQRMTAVTNVKRTFATLYPIAIVLLADVADIGHPFEGP